jgi:hypothetical protein
MTTSSLAYRPEELGGDPYSEQRLWEPRTGNLDYVMGDAYELINTAKTKFSTSRVVLRGVLRRRDVSLLPTSPLQFVRVDMYFSGRRNKLLLNFDTSTSVTQCRVLYD